ncbi:MAG: chemotaxis protein CheW [Maricaulis sp.]|jgi:two-component system chemotaxis sensor kinase CheA|uniref:chemotaxis protein CheW n=1 Tax=Maricaulis sp. TaxID=1486257 RepID=UPI001B0770A1|nr:chemotaxis protein CheW [Maricaulis sp.]MBO6729044.1 chemotaxis protein CheA [Maricaulis sp.]MBO6847964.1 chemotaxis protein CheA [Maricaulis sp.]MBO6877658.1 chemotaxis protein CheA [Maricaulis sp.]MDM7984094.1 chemotaxis protein CheW [Maricaulis sp.]
MDDLISEFLTETAESLDVIDSELVRFENNPDDRAILDNIFRLLHTVKGTCGFLGLPRLEAVAHAGETLLGKFRDGELQVTPPMVTLVLESIDQIKVLLESLEATGSEPAGDDQPLIKRLEDAAMGKLDDAAPAEAAAPAEPEVPDDYDQDLGRELRPGEVSLADLEAAFQNAESDVPVENPADTAAAESEEHLQAGDFDPELGRELRPGEVSSAELEAAFAAAEPDPGMEPGTPEVITKNMSTEEALATAMAELKGGDAATGEGGLRVQQTVRVGVDVLEALMTTVSELVLTRNQLMQTVRGLEDDELKGPLQRLSAVTGELQDGVMKTRMQPIGDAWRKLPRIIRDVSTDLGKKIELFMEGQDTELDRQVLELIKDPLTHMVRNSADHGLEMPEDRVKAGKSEKGTIKLSAYHEGGHIIIAIADDGKGLDTKRIGEKALEKGLTTHEELARLTEAQIHRFIFAPGFSTAAKVTNLSGRGVGMDVVRTNIEQIGGVVDVSSAAGRGSHFTIKIPLTLAIVSALIVGCQEQRFAIPQLAVRELVRVGMGSEHTVEKLNGASVMRLRDRLMPIVDLQGVLRLDGGEGADEEAGFVVVLDAGGRNVGVVVDNVLDTEEIVVKPLSDSLRGVSAYSGATILGDGSVIMILDPNGLAGDIVSAMEKESSAEALAAANIDMAQTQRLLLVRAGGEEPKAVPLSLVTRLEEFDPDTIEHTNGHNVVQYRGRLMPIVPLGDQIQCTEGQRQPVLVFAENHTSIGLAVDEIVDVVEERVDLQMGSDREGVIGSAIIKGKATDVVDIAWYLDQSRAGDIQRRTSKRRRRVLLVDADAFARRMIAPLLAAAGYDVTPTGGMHEVNSIAEAEEQFDVLVGDPAALARIQSEGMWADLPTVAVTDWPDDGSGEGLTAVLPRSDRSALIATLDQVSQQENAA